MAAEYGGNLSNKTVGLFPIRRVRIAAAGYRTGKLPCDATGGLSVTPGEASGVGSVVASSLSATDSIGVCWGSACVVNSREVFIEHAKRLVSGETLLWLWVDFHGKKGFLGKGNLRTAGLKDLGLMEIEVSGTRRSMKEALCPVLNMAYYLLDNGPAIKECDTAGGSNEERSRVLIVSSSWDENGQVYLLYL